jgi:hypothetical protein
LGIGRRFVLQCSENMPGRRFFQGDKPLGESGLMYRKATAVLMGGQTRRRIAGNEIGGSVKTIQAETPSS